MSAAFKQVIENIKALSPDEKAFVAHCLISSLESTQDDGVDEAWARLAEERVDELKSGKVNGLDWQQIKYLVKGEDA